MVSVYSTLPFTILYPYFISSFLRRESKDEVPPFFSLHFNRYNRTFFFNQKLNLAGAVITLKIVNIIHHKIKLYSPINKNHQKLYIIVNNPKIVSRVDRFCLIVHRCFS